MAIILQKMLYDGRFRSVAGSLLPAVLCCLKMKALYTGERIYLCPEAQKKTAFHREAVFGISIRIFVQISFHK